MLRCEGRGKGEGTAGGCASAWYGAGGKSSAASALCLATVHDSQSVVASPGQGSAGVVVGGVSGSGTEG